MKMFVGRKAELRELNSLYDSGKFECVAVYGRRHIGKTALISEFIKDKDAIYFSARELTDKYNLEAFKRAIAEHFGISYRPNDNDFRQIRCRIPSKSINSFRNNCFPAEHKHRKTSAHNHVCANTNSFLLQTAATASCLCGL